MNIWTKLARIKRYAPMAQFEIMATLFGDFKYGDGFAYLVYAESADHAQTRRCTPVGSGDWSCHLHMGTMGGAYLWPAHWDHSCKFCAYGRDRDQAIRNVVKLALTKPKSR